MYNHEIKEEYIKENENKNSIFRYTYTRWFNITESEEEENKKDLCNFTVSEILSFYKKLYKSSFTSLMVINNGFRNYTQWCQNRSLLIDHQNHYDEITTEMITGCLNQGFVDASIYTRKSLLSLTDDLLNASDAFIILGIFEGIMGIGLSDFFDLTMNDFDGNRLILPDRTITVSDKLIELAKDASETYVFTSETGGVKPLKKDDIRIIKDSWNSFEDNTPARNRRKIRNKILRIQKSRGIPLKPSQLAESGRIDMMLRLHKEGETFEDTLNNNIKQLNYYYPKIYSRKRWLAEYSKYLLEFSV